MVRATNPLLEAFEFRRGQAVGLADDGDDVDARRQAAHQLDVHLAQAVQVKIY